MKSFIKVALIVLGTVFTTLKLCGVITWSWWFVLAPFYVPLAIVIVILILLLATVGAGVLAKLK
jgi:hypothetical protein